MQASAPQTLASQPETRNPTPLTLQKMQNKVCGQRREIKRLNAALKRARLEQTGQYVHEYNDNSQAETLGTAQSKRDWPISTRWGRTRLVRQHQGLNPRKVLGKGVQRKRGPGPFAQGQPVTACPATQMACTRVEVGRPSTLDTHHPVARQPLAVGSPCREGTTIRPGCAHLAEIHVAHSPVLLNYNTPVSGSFGKRSGYKGKFVRTTKSPQIFPINPFTYRRIAVLAICQRFLKREIVSLFITPRGGVRSADTLERPEPTRQTGPPHQVSRGNFLNLGQTDLDRENYSFIMTQDAGHCSPALAVTIPP